MSTNEKLDVIRLAECSGLPKAQVLAKFDIPPSTYYRWQRKFRRGGRIGLDDLTTRRGPSWNQLLDDERQMVLDMAILYPELSSRELAFKINDSCEFSVSK